MNEEDFDAYPECSAMSRWLGVLVFVTLFLGVIWALEARAEKPEGAPPSTPEEQNFFNSAHSGAGGPYGQGLSCCSEADGYREGIVYPERLNAGYPHPGGVILREWVASKTVPGGYRVNIAGLWRDIPPDLVVRTPPNPPNITGGAVIWVTFTFLSVKGPDYSYKMTNVVDNMTIRCFAPGNQF